MRLDFDALRRYTGIANGGGAPVVDVAAGQSLKATLAWTDFPSTPAVTQAPAATFRTYKVRSGDTLSGIAADYGTTARAIAALNGITVNSTLHIGQVLKIPNPS